VDIIVFRKIICSFDILCSLVERARKTVRGSADDIGWLQRDQSLPRTEDGSMGQPDSWRFWTL